MTSIQNIEDTDAYKAGCAAGAAEGYQQGWNEAKGAILDKLTDMMADYDAELEEFGTVQVDLDNKVEDLMEQLKKLSWI